MAEGGSVFYLPSPYGEGTVVLDAHGRGSCFGNCPLHRPSAHWAVDLPLQFVRHQDLGYSAMYRVCEHGNLHADPDDHQYRQTKLGLDTSLSIWPICPCRCCPIYILGSSFPCYSPTNAPRVLPLF